MLGSLRVWHDDSELELGPPGRRAVLGLLVLAGGEAVAKHELMDALWGDRPPRSAVNVLQTHVKHLRRLLEPDRPPRTSSEILPHVGDGYAVRWDAVDVDLLRVRRLVAEATDAHRSGDTARAAELLGAALRLWRGRPLADIPFLATHPKVVSLVIERREVLARYGDAMLATGAAADVLVDLTEAAVDQPLDESAQARLIRAYHAVGQRAKAFRTYHEVRDRLVEELGVDPGPELLAAHAALLYGGGATGSTGGPRPVHQVPRQLPAEPRGFTGRATQLSALDTLLSESGRSGGAVTIAAISGTAGVGKTALAVHWAHRVRDRFPDGQLHANLRGHTHGEPAQPIEVLAQFLSALDVPVERVPLDVETASALYRTLMVDRRTLVLLDNVAGPDQVRPLLPAGPGCLVVVTGRERMAGLVAMHGARQFTLEVLSPKEAVEVLADVLGPERIRAEHAAAVEFAELCAHLPLALRVAAANLADRPGCGIEEYAKELREGNLLAALAVRGDEQTAVRTAFDLSYAALPGAAQRLFRLLSLASGADVSAEAAAALAGTDPRQASHLLDRLAAAHLVEHHVPGRYRFHDLLRRYAAEQAHQQESAAEREAALHRLYDWYLNAVDGAARLLYPHMLRLPVPETVTRTARMPAGITDLAGASSWLDAERDNLVAAVRSAAQAGPRPMAWQLADVLRGYFWMCLRRVEWQATAEAGLAAADEAGEPRARAVTRLSLADLRFRQGRYRQAVRHYAHGILIARRAGWVEAQAALLCNLAYVYRQSGQLAAAATRLGRGLALSRQIGQVAGEAVVLGNLGVVQWEMGRLSRAVEHYTRALALHRRIGSRYGEAMNLNNLGQVQRVRGLLTEARDLLTQALVLNREAGNLSGAAETHSLLAVTYGDLGRLTDALDHARAGLTLAEETDDPRAGAEALAALATTRLRLGHRQDAIRHYRAALDLIRETGDRYPEVDILISMATATADIERAQRALTLAKRARYRALQGRATNAIAGILLAQGKREDAADHARRAVAIHCETGHHLGEVDARTVLVQAASETRARA